jgi:alpha-1,6-mannosyltransferase
MHLLDVTMLYAPTSGGVVRYLRAKRTWLRRHTSVRHSLLVPGDTDGAGPTGERYLRTASLRPHGYRWPFAAHRWVRAVRAARPDLIEVGDAGPEAWATLWAARSLDVPVIAFCHSDIVRMAERRLGPIARVATQIYSREFYRRCDLVLAPSAFMAERLRHWGVARAIVRPLGVDIDTFSPQRRSPSLRRELGLPARTRVLAYAGRFSREKNVSVLLEAFRRLGPRYHLVLAGPTTLTDLPENVTLLPFLHSSRELARILASADGFVHAGDQETFGLVLIEAMACGRGVVAANAGAMPEIVTPDTGVLVPPHDVSALIAGIRDFYDHGPERFGRAARQRAETEYTWSATMRALLELYRGALVSGGVRATGYATS